MGFVNLNELAKMSVEDQIAIKKMIINTNELNTIPIGYLPDVSSTEYFFISYSHLDYKEVYCDIFDLQEAGLPIWYDRAIGAGQNWKTTANAYMAPNSCRGAIFYISENALLSESVRSEIEFANSIGKQFLVIFISHKKESLKSMIERLYNEKKIDKGKYDFFNSTFKEEIIYLPIREPSKSKVEKINNSLSKEKTLSIFSCKIHSVDKNSGRPTGYYLNIDGLNNPFVAEITIKDYLELIDFKYLIDNNFYDPNQEVTSNPKINIANPIKNISDMSLLKVNLDIASFANVTTLEYFEYPLIGKAGDDPIIGEYAFYRCQRLKQFKFVVKQDAVSKPNVFVGRGAFRNCHSLKQFDFENVGFDDECFEGCRSLLSVDLSKSKCRFGLNPTSFELCDEMKIPRRAFSGCFALKEVVFPKELKHIGEYAFTYTAIETLKCPPSLISIGNSAFGVCGHLKCVELNEGLETLGAGAFFQAPINKIVLPSTLKKIGEGAFLLCTRLKTIELNEGLEEIESSAFTQTAINTIKFPSSLKKIGSTIFLYCFNIKKVFYDGTNEQFNKIISKTTFDRCESDIEIVFKDGSALTIPSTIKKNS